jgi:hypothetical protein
MKKITFDFPAYVEAQKNPSVASGGIRFGRERTSGRRFRRRKKKKTLLHKATKLAREALEIYYLVQNRNNPLALGLGLVSSAGALLDVFEIGNKSVNKFIEEEMGLTRSSEGGYGHVAEFYDDMLKRLGYEGLEVFGDEEAEESVVQYTLSDGSEVAFIHEGTDGAVGPFVYDKDKFHALLKKEITDEFGTVLALDMTEENYERKTRLVGLNRPQSEIYVDCNGASESVLVDEVETALEMGVGRSYIFFGAPGTGKTTLAFRLAERMNKSMLVFNHDLLTSNGAWIARAVPLLDPDIILFDDIDRVWDPGKLLFYIDSLNAGKPRVMIGTINKLSRLPKALRRPGRFDSVKRFPLPTAEQAVAIMRAHAEALKLDISDEDLAVYAEHGKGLSGAYLREVVLRTRLVDKRDVLLSQIDDMHELAAVKEDPVKKKADDDEDDD